MEHQVGSGSRPVRPQGTRSSPDIYRSLVYPVHRSAVKDAMPVVFNVGIGETCLGSLHESFGSRVPDARVFAIGLVVAAGAPWFGGAAEEAVGVVFVGVPVGPRASHSPRGSPRGPR